MTTTFSYVLYLKTPLSPQFISSLINFAFFSQVISPGSETTLAQFGLPETLAPASIQIPTRVYAHPNHPGKPYFSSKGEEKDVIYPIQAGKIVNLPAFCYFL